MITLTFCLRFTDNQNVTAQIKAANKTEDTPVSYSGAVERLHLSLQTANAIELRAYFKSFARELHAAFDEQEQDDRVVSTLQLDETLEHLLEVGRKRHQSSAHSAKKVDQDHEQPLTV